MEKFNKKFLTLIATREAVWLNTALTNFLMKWARSTALRRRKARKCVDNVLAMIDF